MDVRSTQRMLEKIQGLAETAEHVGARTWEMAQREPRLSDAAKARLEPLYRTHALRLMHLYCELGLQICATIENEMDDEMARGQLDLFRANFTAMKARAEKELDANS